MNNQAFLEHVSKYKLMHMARIPLSAPLRDNHGDYEPLRIVEFNARGGFGEPPVIVATQRGFMCPTCGSLVDQLVWASHGFFIECHMEEDFMNYDDGEPRVCIGVEPHLSASFTHGRWCMTSPSYLGGCQHEVSDLALARVCVSGWALAGMCSVSNMTQWRRRTRLGGKAGEILGS